MNNNIEENASSYSASLKSRYFPNDFIANNLLC